MKSNASWFGVSSNTRRIALAVATAKPTGPPNSAPPARRAPGEISSPVIARYEMTGKPDASSSRVRRQAFSSVERMRAPSFRTPLTALRRSSRPKKVRALLTAVR